MLTGAELVLGLCCSEAGARSVKPLNKPVHQAEKSNQVREGAMDRGSQRESESPPLHASNAPDPRTRTDGSIGATCSAAGPMANHEPADRRLEVLVGGNLTLDLQRRTRAKKSDLAATLKSAASADEAPVQKTLGSPEAGGFVAGAGRVAYSLWCRVDLAC